MSRTVEPHDGADPRKTKTAATNGGNKAQSAENAPDENSSACITRRDLCIGLGGTAALFGLGSLKYVGSKPGVRPPGGQDEDQLLSACIRCEKCFEICPHNVIKPAHIEDGIFGMRTPRLDFHSGWCDWCGEANNGNPLCVAVCPTHALTLSPDATKEKTILGKAVINKDWCLAYKLIGCRYCYDACPYEALKLDENNRPYLVDDLCNGCGACESVCVSLKNASVTQGATNRAIVIVSHEAWKEQQ